MSGHQAGIYRATQPIIAEIERLTGKRPEIRTYKYGPIRRYSVTVNYDLRWFSEYGRNRVDVLRIVADQIQRFNDKRDRAWRDLHSAELAMREVIR